MLSVTVQSMGGVAVLRCVGRIVAGEDTRALRDSVTCPVGRRLVALDLAEVQAIDAAGLGVLLFLLTLACIVGTELKLMNPTERTRELLALTNLDSVFEICSAEDVDWLLSGAEHAHLTELGSHLYPDPE